MIDKGLLKVVRVVESHKQNLKSVYVVIDDNRLYMASRGTRAIVCADIPLLVPC